MHKYKCQNGASKIVPYMLCLKYLIRCGVHDDFVLHHITRVSLRAISIRTIACTSLFALLLAI